MTPGMEFYIYKLTMYQDQEFKQALAARKQDWKKVWNVQKSNDRESDYSFLTNHEEKF